MYKSLTLTGLVLYIKVADVSLFFNTTAVAHAVKLCEKRSVVRHELMIIELKSDKAPLYPTPPLSQKTKHPSRCFEHL